MRKKQRRNGVIMKKRKSKEVNKRAVWVMFCKGGDLGKIRTAFSDRFEILQTENSNSAKISVGHFDMEFTVLLPSMGKEEEQFIKEQKGMVCGFFSQVQGHNKKDDIKINLCHYIRQTQAYIYMELKMRNPKEGWEEDLDDVKGRLLDAAEEVEGILIVEDGTVVLGAVDGRGGILLNQQGYSEFESYFPFVPKENRKMLGDCTEKQKERRNKNMEYLFKKGIYACELPLNKDEDSVLLRDKEEVVRRAFGVLVVSLASVYRWKHGR